MQYNPEQSHRWRDQELLAPCSPEDIQIEASIGWPEGTIKILRSACKKRLSRQIELDLSDIHHTEPFKVAASYFFGVFPVLTQKIVELTHSSKVKLKSSRRSLNC